MFLYNFIDAFLANIVSKVCVTQLYLYLHAQDFNLNVFITLCTRLFTYQFTMVWQSCCAHLCLKFMLR